MRKLSNYSVFWSVGGGGAIAAPFEFSRTDPVDEKIAEKVAVPDPPLKNSS